MSAQSPGSRPRGSFGGIASGASARSRSRATDQTAAGLAPSEEAMRAARRRWASGVAVALTLDGEPGQARYRGATVTAFTIVSLEPPLLLICLDRETATARLIPTSEIFSVSIVDRTQEFLADRFAGLGPLPDAALTGIPYQTAATGCPILSDALAWFDCRLSALHDGGDHVIVVGEILALGLGPDNDDPLLTYEGAYRRIESA